jgi:5-methylcytosine-specific restriction endonuclease McrA
VNKKAKPFKDLAGQVFGKWIVLRLAPTRSGQTEKFWCCRCSCGTEKDISGSRLRLGRSKSCKHPAWKDRQPDLIVPEGHRVCSRCLKVKPERDFYGEHSWCAQCIRTQKRIEYENDPEKFKRRVDQRRNNCPEKVAQERALWREKNLGYISPCRLANPAYGAQWREEHREQCSEYTRRWAKKNPEVLCAREARRRARIAKAKFGDQKLVRAFYRWLREQPTIICHWCRKVVPLDQRCADHYVPLSKGGAHSVENLVPCCWSCNSRKRDMLPEEFLLTMPPAAV